MVAIRRMLITGMSGFVGRHLVAHLADASLEVVSGLDGASLDGRARVDVRDCAAVRAALERIRPDVVFHLAGRIKAVDRSRIERELGWSPKISLEQSLGDLLEDWRRRTGELSDG